MLTKRSPSGRFTLIEIIVLVIIVIILARIAMPGFIRAKNQEREVAVRNNMRITQVAAESYANDSAGEFPKEINDAFKSYFPGGPGDGQKVGKARGPVNPFTGQPEWPKLGNLTDVKSVRSKPPSYVGPAGTIEYSPIADPKTGAINSYSIRGANKDGVSLSDTAANTSLVLSHP